MTTAPVVNDRIDPFASERAELEAVQTSALFQRPALRNTTLPWKR